MTYINCDNDTREADHAFCERCYKAQIEDAREEGIEEGYRKAIDENKL